MSHECTWDQAAMVLKIRPREAPSSQFPYREGALPFRCAAADCQASLSRARIDATASIAAPPGQAGHGAPQRRGHPPTGALRQCHDIPRSGRQLVVQPLHLVALTRQLVFQPRDLLSQFTHLTTRLGQLTTRLEHLATKFRQLAAKLLRLPVDPRRSVLESPDFNPQFPLA